jgi:hypothetical protein
MPPTRLSFALVIFVLAPGGHIATIGGQELTEGHVAPLPGRGAGLADMVRNHMERVLPPDTITSRLRPLMPRLRGDGVVVLPLWATGRLPSVEVWRATLGRIADRPFDALGRLADQLHDPSLVTEAHSEFRRALASDPVSHQLMSEGGRLRALAMDELDAASARELGIPPVFGLLPDRFTIEHLQLAVTQAARLHEGDIQKSSNFRRRLVEFIDFGVLERTEGVVPTDAKGRPPQLYRFNRERWMAWLLARRGDHEPSPRVLRMHRSVLARDADFEGRVLDARPGDAPQGDASRGEVTGDILDKDILHKDILHKDILDKDILHKDILHRDARQGEARRGVSGHQSRESPSAPASFREQRSPRSARMMSGFTPHPAELEPSAGTADADRARVERLERMMRSLMGEIADLKRSSGNATDPSGPSGMPPVE